MKPLTATELLVVFVLAAALSASFQPNDDPPPAQAPAVVFTQPAGIDRYQALVELGVLEARHGQ